MRTEEQKQWARIYYLKNKERWQTPEYRAKARARYYKNREHNIANAIRWHKENPVSEEKRKAYHWKWAYGLSEDQAKQLLSGGCNICGKKATHIDHNHSTGKVRGALCLKCNAGIGMLQDNQELVKKAVEYLAEDIR